MNQSPKICALETNSWKRIISYIVLYNESGSIILGNEGWKTRLATVLSAFSRIQEITMAKPYFWGLSAPRPCLEPGSPKSPIILKNLVTIGKFNSFQLSIYSNSNGCCSLIVSLDLHKDLDKCLKCATLISKNDESFGWAALAFACSLNRRWKANLDWITLLRQYHQSSFNCILLTANFALKSLGSDPAVSYWCFENSWCCWIKTPCSSP